MIFDKKLQLNGAEALFLTPAAKAAIGWSECRPTGMKEEAWTVQIGQI
jgi:hypothetical protein